VSTVAVFATTSFLRTRLQVERALQYKVPLTRSNEARDTDQFKSLALNSPVSAASVYGLSRQRFARTV
jgi:hypothetical protein